MRLILIVSIFLSFSCSNSKFVTGTYQEEIGGYQVVFNPKTGLKVKYYGDYSFDKMHHRTTPKLDRSLAKNIRKSKKTKRLFDSYTELVPHLSSQYYWFKKSDLASVKKTRASFLTKKEKATFSEQEITGDKTPITQLKYSYPTSVGDSIATINFCEYLFDTSEGTGSIIFWSFNTTKWLERESLGIMETLSIEK
jgi:hypothetical protein